MLDCANGHQEEKEETDQFEEGFRQESEADKEADAEDEDCKEISEEGVRFEEDYGEEEKLEESDAPEDRACEQQTSARENSSTAWAGVF